MNLSKSVGIAALFLVIFLSGYGLHRSGKPYHTLLFSLHKLISLGVMVWLLVTATRAQRVEPLSALELSLVIAATVLFVATIASGGLVSLEKPAPVAIAWVHKLLPYLTAASSAAAWVFLTR